MNDQMKRLYLAAETLKKIRGQSALARFLNASPQTLKNWESRGVSSQGMVSAQELLGCSAVWIETGKGKMQIGDGVQIPSQVHDGQIEFELLDIQAAAGNGHPAQEFPQVIQRVNVLESWARQTLGGDLSRIKLITANGTSMQGTIDNGDVLFVDVTVRQFDGDGIYVISRSNEIQVKRLQRLHGKKLAIISDNKENISETLSAQEANEVVICGRVLAAWNLKRLWL
ncbi:MAG: helix-turn-helix transcriptional regulator [Sheuella sp.]|nr:helix-turn-helix transcriptional regulator [Sheuella sp.]